MSELARTAIATALTALALLALWAFATGPGGVESFVLPPPAAVLGALRQGWIDGLLLPHVAYTGRAALVGLAIGATLGIAVGGIVSMVRPLEYFMVPLVSGMQSVPKIAVAPLIIAYFGFGIESKVFTVALLTFFPLFVATVAGLRSVDANIVDMYRAFSASRLHILIHARLPAAGNYIFGALQIAVVLALIGAVISEFIASTKGLGFVIKTQAGELDISVMFAAIISLALMGVAAGALVRFAQRRVLFWIDPAR